MSDFLSDEEQSERLRSWVVRYGLWVLLVIVLGISAYFFFEYSSEQRRIASENSTALLEQFLDAVKRWRGPKRIRCHWLGARH